MPSGNPHWKHLRESIRAFFHFSELSSLFEITFIESEGGAAPSSIYKSMVNKSDVLLAIFGNAIPPGQQEEIIEAKKLDKIVFGFFLDYQPMLGNGEDNRKLLYDVATVNPITNHYDLFAAIRNQLIGFFSHSINDIKRITPKLIEKELKLAFDEDSEELLARVGDLIEKVGTDDTDIYLMTNIYLLEADIKEHLPLDNRLLELGRDNLRAWKILLAIALTKRDRELFDYCLTTNDLSTLENWLNNLFMSLTNEEARRKLLKDEDFIRQTEELATETIYSCQIFEDITNEVFDDW